MIKNFTDMEVWKIADELLFMIIKDCKTFPRSIEAKIITGQTIRSVSSVSALIAEGVGRGGINELIRYLIMARGSVVESQNWLLKINRLQWLPNDRFEEYMQMLSDDRQQINAFIGKLRKN